MKKSLIALLYMLLISTALKAQVYVNAGWNNKGATMGAGALYKNIDGSLMFGTDFTKRGVKNLGFSIGRQILLSHWGEDDWLIMPVIGVNNTYSKIYASCKYIKPREVTTTKPSYGFDLGNNQGDGRIVFSYQHSDTDHYGIAIRVNIIQLQKVKRPWR